MLVEVYIKLSVCVHKSDGGSLMAKRMHFVGRVLYMSERRWIISQLDLVRCRQSHVTCPLTQPANKHH